jgi:hypothetical protein
MKRSSIVAATAAATLLAAVPTADAAAPSGQYVGKVNGGGKFVVDVAQGRVTTLQAYYPVNCQSQDDNVGGEILLDGLSVKLKHNGFTVRSTKQPKALIKGTFNRSGSKVTGTIALNAASLKQTCAQDGGVAANPPVAFSATKG